MSSMWGERIKISVFGESHGPAIGVVIDGLPGGEEIDLTAVAAQMARRAPGRDRTATARKEDDLPEILSGFLDGKTTGAPLCAVIRNTNTRSADYSALFDKPRPSHADYTARLRYGEATDLRGGGHFSGRLTAPLCFSGAVCRQILARRGIVIGAHIASIGPVKDASFDPVQPGPELLERLSRSSFALIDPSVEEYMRREVEAARMEEDSVGGIIECAALGLPGGLGSPMFGGVENVLSSLLFGIPAVRGLEFGAGFAAAKLRGSDHNDAFYYDGGDVCTRTNRHGGAIGGITSGMPLIFRLAFKPPPSISRAQETVNLRTHAGDTLRITGRHDPCIVPRAVPVVEAVTAVALIHLMAEGGKL